MRIKIGFMSKANAFIPDQRLYSVALRSLPDPHETSKQASFELLCNKRQPLDGLHFDSVCLVIWKVSRGVHITV